MEHNNSGLLDTPMQTGSPNASPVKQDNFGYISFHTPYKVEQSLSQFNQTQKQFDNRYLTPSAVSYNDPSVLGLSPSTQNKTTNQVLIQI